MDPDLITLLPGHLSIIKVNTAQPGICGRDQQLAYGRVDLRVVDGFQHSHEKNGNRSASASKNCSEFDLI